MKTETHPLRIAYVRLIQARLAIHLTMLEVDEALGGDDVYLQEILNNISDALLRLERVAVAEHIALYEEDE